MKKFDKHYTTIQISQGTKEKLLSLKLTPGETYENILLRMLFLNLGNREIMYEVSHNDIKVKVIVDWGGDFANIKFLDDEGNWKYNFHKLESMSDEEFLFFKNIFEHSNLLSNFSVLSFDESIPFGDVLLKRIS